MSRPRKNPLPEGIYQRGAVYWIQYRDAHGERHRESAGRSIDDARRLRAQRLASVRDGTHGRDVGGRSTLTAYAEAFFRAREAKVRTTHRERQLFADFVAPHLGGLRLEEIRPSMVADWISRLPVTMAPKSVRNAHGVLSAILADARFRDHVLDNAAKDLPPGTFPAVISRPKASWTRAEVETFVSDDRIDLDRRVGYAVAAFTGARLGEIAGLRWCDLDTSAAPLWRWTLRHQYDGQPLKTGQPRDVPIHAELRRILAAWKLEGWPMYVGRVPVPADLVVPRQDGTHHSDNSLGAKAIARHAATLGIDVGDRDFHSFRRFFVTHCRVDGAPKDIVERITHNADGEQIDGYTYWGWDVLCDAVSRLRLEVRRGAEVTRLGHTRGHKAL